MSLKLVVQDGISIDLGGTKTSAARVKNGAVVRHVQTATDGTAGIGLQLATVTGLLADLELKPTDAIGAAVTGRLDQDGNWYALNKSTLTNIEAIPLRRLLCETFGRDVRVLNDATAAAVGEYVAGSGLGCRSIGYITVSTGIGGGFIIDGRPLMSASGLAGHVGFTTSRHADSLCGSGRFGTVESVAAGKAIARQAQTEGYADLDARAVYHAHLGGAEWASQIIQRSASAVAELCANIKAILDPDVIVLGGSVGLAEGYIDLVRLHLAEEPAVFRPVLKPSALGAHAALIGVLAT